ncbi:MAG: phosphatidylserine decarboxylase [Planctomycetota bacterium]
MKFTRHGFKEMLIGTLVLLLVAAGLGFTPVWWLGLLTLPVLVWLFAFFRDPERAIPDSPENRIAMVSPADGKVSDVTEIDHDPVLGEPSLRIGIFLSVFNVHINRSPCDAVVKQTIYKKGKFINALDHNKASEENESNTIVLADPADRDKPVAVVKQIVGLIARRIVCTKDEGETVLRGERIGMIKFGSRTELTIPKRLAPEVHVEVNQKVQAGKDVLAVVDRFGAPHRTSPDPEMQSLAEPTPA